MPLFKCSNPAKIGAALLGGGCIILFALTTPHANLTPGESIIFLIVCAHMLCWGAY
jgi:hypothetical protein